jgi:hypothetical protein
VRSERRALGVALPHVVLLAAMAAGVAWGAARLDVATRAESTAYVANVFWTLHNAACLLPFVAAALLPRRRAEVAP